MTLPVLSPASTSPTPVDHSARPNDGPPEASPFSNVLSGQRNTAAVPSQAPDTGAHPSQATDTKSQDSLGPAEALALILDAVGLPLMQASTTRADQNQATDTKSQDSLGPAEASALTALGSVGLPLMQTPTDIAKAHQVAGDPSQISDTKPKQAKDQPLLPSNLGTKTDITQLGKTESPAAQGHTAIGQQHTSAQALATQAQIPIEANGQARFAQQHAPAQALATQAQHVIKADGQAQLAQPHQHASAQALVNAGQPVSRTDANPQDIAKRFSTTHTAHRASAGATDHARASSPGTAGNLSAADTNVPALMGAAAHAATTGAVNDTLLANPSAAPIGATLLASSHTPGNTTAAASIQINVPAPINSPQWPHDVGRQLLSFAQGGAAGTHTVMMHVNPPELGPVRITLHLGDSIQASFVSPHANVRQALENALPNLQQQLAQSGLSLGQANVSDQSAQQQFAQGSGQSSKSDSAAIFSLDGTTDTAASLPGIAAPTQRPIRPDALVDTFA